MPGDSLADLNNPRAQVRFVVLSMPRTGSSMLTEQLSTHAAVRCLPAIFSSTGWPNRGQPAVGGLKKWIDEKLSSEWGELSRRVAKPRKLLAEIAEASADKTAIGFKHHLSAEAREVTELLLKTQLRKIILTRNNLLACYSSQKIVEVTGQGAARARRPESVVRALARFDAKEFSGYCAHRTALYDKARTNANGQKLEIDYVLARTKDGLATVARFLRIDPNGFGPPKTAKRNSDDIVSRFENPDDVRHYLKEHALEHWAVEN